MVASLRGAGQSNRSVRRKRAHRAALRRLGGRGVIRASGGYTVRRREGQRGPVALRPRLSPGVPLSRDGATDLWCGTGAVKHLLLEKG
jgi:hypothetical protein